MTVKELIVLLKEQKQDLPVVFEDENGDEVEDFTIDEAYGVVVMKGF
jgi:hypothetical protein